MKIIIKKKWKLKEQAGKILNWTIHRIKTFCVLNDSCVVVPQGFKTSF